MQISNVFICCGKNVFYRFVCQNCNFIMLNQLNVTHHKANEIVSDFTSACGCNACIRNFEEYHLMLIHYVYSQFFLKFVMLNQKYDVQVRSRFMIHYKNCIDSKRKNAEKNKNYITTTTTTATTKNIGKMLLVIKTEQNQKFRDLNSDQLQKAKKANLFILKKQQLQKKKIFCCCTCRFFISKI